MPSFQSLLGFLMRCDLRGDGGIVSLKRMFQSLLGFLMRCDSMIAEGRAMNGFQSLLGFLMRCDQKYDDVEIIFIEFQSLLGFLMRCDAKMCLERLQPLICFNPCWVF